MIRHALILLLSFFALAANADEAALARLTQVAEKAPPTEASPLERCRFFYQRGMANFRMGQHSQAKADFNAALVLEPETADEGCNRWRIQHGLIQTIYRSGDILGSLDLLREVEVEARAVSPYQLYSVYALFSRSLRVLGRLAEAEAMLKKVADLQIELEKRPDWPKRRAITVAMFYAQTSYLHAIRGDHAQAEIFRRLAIVRLEEALWQSRNNPQVFKSTRDWWIDENMDLADHIAAQGRPGEARHLLLKMLDFALESHGPTAQKIINIRSVLGAAAMQQGHLDEADGAFQKALAAQNASDQPKSSLMRARLHRQMARLFILQERWKAALDTMETRQNALLSDPKLTEFAERGDYLWAMALIRNGRASEAAAMMQQRMTASASAKQNFTDLLNRAKMQGVLAVALAETGDTDAARELFRQAIPPLLAYSGETGEADNAISQHDLHFILEGWFALLAGQPEQAAAEAFAVADIARNSSVQRAILASTARSQRPDAALLRQKQDLDYRIRAQNLRLDRLAARQGSPEMQKALYQEIEASHAERDVLARKIQNTAPELAARMFTHALTPTEVQKTLGKNETLVSFYSGEQKTWVWTITGQTVRFRTVDRGRAELSAEIDSLLEAMNFIDGPPKPFPAEAAQDLYAQLLAPDEALFPQDGTLHLVTHGPLGRLPFAALLTRPAEGGDLRQWPWLLRQTAIVHHASVNAFMALQTTPETKSAMKHPFIGFGDPLFIADAEPGLWRGRRFRNLSIKPMGEAKPGDDSLFSRLPALPDTGEELKEIAVTLDADPEQDVFLQNRAAEREVKNADLSRYRVLAFATHGLLPRTFDGIDQPALALSNPSLVGDTDNDGLLSLDEVMALKLDADWVVLSACDTASAEDASAEAASGLARAFFYAGAKSLLVSNWAVESGSARLLTSRLFALQKAHPGLSRAAALRRAMLDVMHTDIDDYAHPCFWAAFRLMGKG